MTKRLCYEKKYSYNCVIAIQLIMLYPSCIYARSRRRFKSRGLFDALEGLAGIATFIMFAMFAFVVIFAMILQKLMTPSLIRNTKREGYF